jgi:hypothetical protein
VPHPDRPLGLAPLVALSALSVDLQLVTLTYVGSLSSLVWLNLVFTATLLIVRITRSRILSWMRNIGSAVRASITAAPRWALWSNWMFYGPPRALRSPGIVNTCRAQDQPISTLTGQEVPFIAVECPAQDTDS